MLDRVKGWVQEHPFLYDRVCWWRARAFEQRLAGLREHYQAEALRLGLWYDENAIRLQLQEQLHDRAPTRPRAWGEVHTFLVDDGGQYTRRQMGRALQNGGRLSLMDWEAAVGCLPSQQDRWPLVAREGNDKLVRQIRSVHETQGIDVVMVASLPGTFLPESATEIRAIGLPVAGLWLDDLHSFHAHLGGTKPGDCPLAALIDLHWTSTRECALWYLVEGAAPLYMAEGGCPHLFNERPGTGYDYDVSFLGQRYGQRLSLIQRLRKRGLRVQCLGRGWEGGFVPLEQIAGVYAKSRINLGVGGVLHSMNVTCLKGRDFEVPMAGGLYLTSDSDELADWYRIGEEILCYRDVKECVDIARYYLGRPDAADRVRRAGARRARSEHTWEHRFRRLYEFMGLC